MESQSVPTLDQLKEANSTSFDLHTKVFMYNSIIKELETSVARDKDDIVLLGQLEADLVERDKDIEQTIEKNLSDYEGLLTTKLELELSESLRGTSYSAGDGHTNLTATHLAVLEQGTLNLEDGYDKNAIVQEIKCVEQDIVRCERDLQKQTEALAKVQLEKYRESRSVFERRNKTILSLVLVWKERLVMRERHRENGNRTQQLLKENQELMAKLRDMERKQQYRGMGQASPTTDVVLPVLSAIANYEKIPSPPPRSPADQSPNNSQEGPTDNVVRREEVVPVQVPVQGQVLRSAIGKIAGPSSRKHPRIEETAPLAQLPVPPIEPLPVQPPVIVEQKKTAAPLEKTVTIVEETPRNTKPAKKASPPKQKTRTSPRIRQTTVDVVQAPEKTTAEVVVQEKRVSPPRGGPVEAQQSSKANENVQSVAMMDVDGIPDVIDSTPTSPANNREQSVNRDQSLMDLDNEFENFGCGSSPGENMRSPAENDDIDGSFFGGGGECTNEDGAGDNWF